jgi:hypothetical protein
MVLALALLAGRRAALAMTLVGAVGSAAWMALQFDPASDPSRVYYGTDTRLTGLLLGAALAFVWVPPVPSLPTLRPGLNRRRRRRLLAKAASARLASGAGWWGSLRLGRGLDLVAIAALAGLGAFFVAADAFEPLLYQGGLAILALLTVIVIAAAVHPRTQIGRVLDVAPLRWVGTRSYSIYLWHWPIFALTRPGLDIPLEAPATLAVRLVLTVMAAEASYRFVEMPIRTGSVGRAWAWVRATQSASATRTRRWSAAPVAGALAAVLSVLIVSVAMATPPPPPAGMETASIDGLVVDPEAQPHDQPPSPRLTVDAVPSHAAEAGARAIASGIAAGDAVPGGAVPTPAATTSPPIAGPTPSPTPSPSPKPRRSILAFGESVMIQGAQAMAHDLGPVRVDAAVGRHVGEGIKILEQRAADGKLADTVIVQLGNNGPFRAGQFDAVMDALRDVRLVVWVNVRVPRDWEAHNNRVIESGVSNYPNARLVDWYGATAGRPELFWKDGYHPRPEGAELYADLITAATR